MVGRSYKWGIPMDIIVARDVELLWSIQDYVYRWPWLDRNMSMIVSKQPWNDIGVVLWLTALLGCFEIGVRHFWVVVTNLGVAFLANRLIRSKRPVEYDIRLQPTTDLHPDSYGIPSLESYMGIVIIGHVFKSIEEIWLKVLFLLFFGIPLVLVLGFSRIYSRARLPHQICVSYIAGIFGLLAGIHYCEKMGGGFHNMPSHTHGVWVGFVVVIFLANLGLNMENNDSRLLFISRTEFIRVMRGIMYAGSGEEQAGEAGRGAVPHYQGSVDDETESFMDASPRPTNNAAAAAFNEGFRQARDKHLEASGLQSRKKKLSNRKDSFYFLQKQMQARAGAGGTGTISSSPRMLSRDNFA